MYATPLYLSKTANRVPYTFDMITLRRFINTRWLWAIGLIRQTGLMRFLNHSMIYFTPFDIE